MEGSRPAAPAEPGTLKASLVATPGLVLAGGRGCGYQHHQRMGVISGDSEGVEMKKRWGWRYWVGSGIVAHGGRASRMEMALGGMGTGVGVRGD